MRQHHALGCLGTLAALVLAAACGQPATSNATGSAAPAAGAAPAKAAPVGNACDRKLVTKDDVTGILLDPITNVKSLAADGAAQTCVFETATFSMITITLRPGLGNVTVGLWASGRMPSAAEPITGIGDKAIWVPSLREVVATKNDVLCDIGVGGPPNALTEVDVVKRRLGEVCTSIFSKQ